MALSKQDKKEIIEIIVKTVNGKIDKLDAKLDAHLTEISTFIDGWRGAKVIGNTIKWIAGVLINIGESIAVLKQIK